MQTKNNIERFTARFYQDQKDKEEKMRIKLNSTLQKYKEERDIK